MIFLYGYPHQSTTGPDHRRNLELNNPKPNNPQHNNQFQHLGYNPDPPIGFVVPAWTQFGNGGPLLEYDGYSSTNIATLPAEQDGGVQEGFRPSSDQHVEGHDNIRRYLQGPESRNDVLQGSVSLVSAASNVTSYQTSGKIFLCERCFESFPSAISWSMYTNFQLENDHAHIILAVSITRSMTDRSSVL